MAASAKVALVTAASAGLGAAIVRALAPHYRVVVNYSLRHEKAQSLIDEVASFPAQYSYAKDQPRSIQSKPMPRDGLSLTDWLTKPVQKMGRLDLVVSNNGWTRVTDFFNLEEQVNEDDWDQCFNINVKSHLWLLYAAKAHLEKSEDGGAFVTVASLAGVRPSGSSLPYSVTKAAEIQLTKGLAIICGKCVRCNSVSPGLMMTEWSARFPEEKFEGTKAKSVLKALATPEDVAEQVKCLAMSNSITGQNVIIDCGIAI